MLSQRAWAQQPIDNILPNSRLWDAVGGFLFLFAHMQEKLSRNSSQVDLLQELLNLQKDLVTMLLSMLEGQLGARLSNLCLAFLMKQSNLVD